MPYGICHLSVVPVRLLPDNAGEMLSQLLYGDHFKLLESRKKWSKIRISFDGHEGWIRNNQFFTLTKEEYKIVDKSKKLMFSSDLISYVSSGDNILIPIVIGSPTHHTNLLSHAFEGDCFNGSMSKSDLVKTALFYLNAPFLWGGKSPFGIDCSGLSQMVYRINGTNIPRSASEQSKIGEALSFIEESEAGDLAFFDDKEGIINHVGIIMKNNFIIHTSGEVRIDRIDHTGIFNTDQRKYTHKLRVIKKII